MKTIQLKFPYKRVLKISDDMKQITLPDSRYYRRNGEFYPSITYVLGSYPKGKHFEDWLKKVGYSSEQIVQKAAKEGTATHELIEDYLNGKDCKFLNEYGKPNYEIKVWQMFLNFVDFWETYNPKLIEVEVHLFSDELKVAGTCDLVCEIEINGKTERWIIDFKTSNQISDSYHLQGAVYAKCYEECFDKKIDRVGVLWVKSKSRGPDKNGKKLKGKGWALIESERSIEDNLTLFKCTQTLFEVTNPKHKPYENMFITEVSRNKQE